MITTNIHDEYLKYKELLEYALERFSLMVDFIDAYMSENRDFYENNRDARLEMEKALNEFETVQRVVRKALDGLDEVSFAYYLASLPDEIKNKPEPDLKNVIKFPTIDEDESNDIWVPEDYDISDIFRNDDKKD